MGDYFNHWPAENSKAPVTLVPRGQSDPERRAKLCKRFSGSLLQLWVFGVHITLEGNSPMDVSTVAGPTRDHPGDDPVPEVDELTRHDARRDSIMNRRRQIARDIKVEAQRGAGPSAVSKDVDLQEWLLPARLTDAVPGKSLTGRLDIEGGVGGRDQGRRSI